MHKLRPSGSKGIRKSDVTVVRKDCAIGAVEKKLYRPVMIGFYHFWHWWSSGGGVKLVSIRI